MSKLDDIFKSLEITHHSENGRGKISNAPVKQAIKDLMLEIVGEDEIRPSEGPKRNGIEQGLRRTRNKVRNELRQKIEDL